MRHKGTIIKSVFMLTAETLEAGCALGGAGVSGEVSPPVPAGGNGRAVLSPVMFLQRLTREEKARAAGEGRNGMEIGTGDPGVLCIFTHGLCSPGLSVEN